MLQQYLNICAFFIIAIACNERISKNDFVHFIQNRLKFLELFIE